MSYLDAILSRKRDEVGEQARKVPLRELGARLKDAPAPRGLFAALAARGQDTQVIAEVKRASPSVGAIRPTLDPVALAGAYARAGAAAISVLTDGPGFGGSLEDLIAVRAAVPVPVLRKDFVVDEYQLVEARAAGADAALLIVAALEDAALKHLHQRCAELGLDALVEVHDAAELDRAVHLGAKLIGINNRNLVTFEVDLGTSERLLPKLPAGTKGVAESGVKGPEDAARLRRAGATNLLVGEALVRAPTPETLLRELKNAR
jgi:indole-3-glycerol phosphate synthase